MINLELPESILETDRITKDLAVNLFRPIARKYDKAEHETPEELEVLRNLRRGGGGKKSGDDAFKTVNKKEKETDAIRNAGQMRLIASTINLSWGCLGLLQSMPGVGLGNAAIASVATKEQKERFGDVYAAMAITEPNTGSDSSSIQTTATLEGEEWVLNGTKIFCTAGSRCTHVVVWATVDKSKGKAAIKSFVVPKDAAGMHLIGCENKLGMRASDTATFVFDNCRIPKDNILGSPEVANTEEGRKKAFGGVMKTFDNTRPMVAAMSVGIAKASLDLTLELLEKEGVKPSYDKSLYNSSSLEAEIYKMEAELEACRLLAYKAAWMADNGQPNSLEASAAKAKAGRVGTDICLRCVEICGSLGYSEEYLLEKFARDQKINDIYEGTQQIQQLIVARRILGLSSKQLK